MIDYIEYHYYYYLSVVFELMHLQLMLLKFHLHHVPKKIFIQLLFIKISNKPFVIMIVIVVEQIYFVNMLFYLKMDFEDLFVIDVELEIDMQLFIQ